MLPHNLDVSIDDFMRTPARSSFSNPVGTVDVLGKTPTILTKVNPCGLSHLI